MRNAIFLLVLLSSFIAGYKATGQSPAPTTQPISTTTSVSALLDESRHDSMSPRQIYEALNQGQTGEILYLLKLLKADPNYLEFNDHMNRTPLHLAAASGSVDAVKWLLEHGAKANTISYSGFTPLHVATDGKIAALLIKAGGDLNAVDSWGNTALQFAAERGNSGTITAILASGFKMDLRSAVYLKKSDVVKSILKENPGVAKKPSKTSGLWGAESPLAIAAGQKNIEIVQLLLDAGADVNEFTFMPNAGGNATALTNAVWAGDLEVIKLLLKNGATMDVTGGKFYPTILEYARKHSSPDVVAVLEEANRLQAKLRPATKDNTTATDVLSTAPALKPAPDTK